jgi:hypothetical protein
VRIGHSIARYIKPFEECLNVELPGRTSSSPQYFSEIDRWIFDKECVVTIVDEADDSKNGKSCSSGR